jgi:hypothetical protein
MIPVRLVFQAVVQASEVVAGMGKWPALRRCQWGMHRTLTDLSGRFDTVVQELSTTAWTPSCGRTLSSMPEMQTTTGLARVGGRRVQGVPHGGARAVASPSGFTTWLDGAGEYVYRPTASLRSIYAAFRESRGTTAALTPRSLNARMPGGVYSVGIGGFTLVHGLPPLAPCVGITVSDGPSAVRAAESSWWCWCWRERKHGWG